MTDQDDLKAITREAHEAIKDLRLLVREAGVVIDRMIEVKEDLLQVSQSVFEDRMSEKVEQGLIQYQASLDAAIERGTQSVYDRFDTLTNILLGKDDTGATTDMDGLLKMLGAQVTVLEGKDAAAFIDRVTKG